MSTKEKAHPTAATVERAGMETAAYGRATISCNQSITTVAGRQRKVSDLLGHGRENAVPLRQLIAITGADGRTIREKIAAERLAGVLSAWEQGGAGAICPQYAV